MCVVRTTPEGAASRVRAAIGLGSNDGDSAATLEAALVALAGLGHLAAISSRYATRAWGVRGQPDFLNAVALLETALAPRALLAALQAIEVGLGRVATYRWGPRAIDLDILTYGDRRVGEPDLTIPHARLLERAFVLVPLAEVDPGFTGARDALGREALAEVRRLPAP